MEVSRGFAKKIEHWISDDMCYKPFETNSNPYKAKVMIVNANAAPALAIDREYANIFANCLVDEELMEDLFDEQLVEVPKDYKGSKKLAKWLKKECDTDAVIGYSNAYMANTLSELKALKKSSDERFERGQQIFAEVLQEFMKVEILLLHGTYALEQFKEQFDEQLEILNPQLTALKDIEGGGQYATLTLGERKIAVFACRSLSTFTANSANFIELRTHLQLAINK